MLSYLNIVYFTEQANIGIVFSGACSEAVHLSSYDAAVHYRTNCKIIGLICTPEATSLTADPAGQITAAWPAVTVQLV